MKWWNKDLYAYRKQIKTKDGKDVTSDTPIADIDGIDFDDFGNIVCFNLEPSLKKLLWRRHVL